MIGHGRRYEEQRQKLFQYLEDIDIEAEEEALGMDLDGDHEEGESAEHKKKVLGEAREKFLEGTWALPTENPKLTTQFFSQPRYLKDRKDWSHIIYNVIGDDDFFDELDETEEKPEFANYDVRHMAADWIRKHMNFLIEPGEDRARAKLEAALKMVENAARAERRKYFQEAWYNNAEEYDLIRELVMGASPEELPHIQAEYDLDDWEIHMIKATADRGRPQDDYRDPTIAGGPTLHTESKKAFKESSERGVLGRSNSYFLVEAPFDVLVKTGTTPSNHHYGAAQLHRDTWAPVTAGPGDMILNLHGGVFLGDPETGKIQLARMSEPEFSPFEKSYGRDKSHDDWPMEYLSQIDRPDITWTRAD